MSERLTKLPDTYAGGQAITNSALGAVVTTEYQDLAMSFANELMTEYDCRTPSEKALARMAAISYTKALDYSEELRNCRAIEFHSSSKNGYFTMIGKEVERANRQFISALATLRQLKAPSLEINITAKNAFVGQNQQFNVGQNEKSYENIKPK